MSSLADKNLSKSAQDKISNITAQAQSGKISWSEANKQANAVRASEGANYTVSSGGTTSYNDGSSISSYKSGSKVSGGGGAQRDYDNYGGSSSGGSADLVKGPGYVTGGYQLGVNGTPILGDNPNWKNPQLKGGGTLYRPGGPDMSRRPDLAGGYAVSNGYTIQYDEDGYARKATKGAIDYLPHKDINASNGTYNTGGAWTDIEMMGDKPGSDYYKIQDIRAALQRGEINGDQANAAANDIRSKYGYTIDKQGNVYDSGVGASVAARRTQYGLDTNVTDAQQKYLQLMFPEQMNQDNGSLLSAYVALKNGNYNPNTVYTGLQQTGQQYTDVSGFKGLGGSFGANLGGSYGGGYGADISDASQYLRDMYAQQIAAELAALKSTYEQNLADISAQDDLISSTYDQQRNQAAAQNDLQRMQMNEYGIMRGLSSGASGQMALAQSAALQGSLAQLGTQEAQSISDNALSRQKLTIAYRNAADQAAAEGNAKLASDLYEEYVRQQELALQQQAAAQEQANWEAKMAYQQQQDALAQQNWQAQFDYQKAQDDLNYQLTLQKLYGANVGSTGSPVKTPSVGYNNGNLTNEQVKVLQNHYGVTADGLWGKNSTNAAGGLTAAQAWEQFTAPVTDVSQLSANGIAVANSLARGYTTGTQQRDAIISAYQNGRITRGEAEFLARAVGASL